MNAPESIKNSTEINNGEVQIAVEQSMMERKDYILIEYVEF
jgi:hypothetical protein